MTTLPSSIINVPICSKYMYRIPIVYNFNITNSLNNA